MEKISVSDLSIGDWVRDRNGIIAKVRGIENWDDGYILNVQAVSGSICALSATGALPIPLTPEILEKNGFRLVVKNNRFDDWHNHPINIRKYDYEDHYRLIVNGWAMPFKMFSVHQPQHALRLACVKKVITL